MKNILVFCLFCAIGLAAYSNSLHSPFMLDDHAFFDETKKNPQFLWYQFLPHKTEVFGVRGLKEEAYYRPLAHVQLMLFYLQFGDRPLWYHAINLVLFILASFLVYIFIGMITANFFVALSTGLLYLVHPMNGYLVNYITASVFASEAMFMILSLIFLWKSNVFPRPSSVFHPILSVTFFLLSLLTHETAFALPIYAFALLIILKNKSFKNALYSIFPFLVAGVVYFLFRTLCTPLNQNFSAKMAEGSLNFFSYLSTLMVLVGWYVKNLFVPSSIVLIWASAPIENVWIGLLGVAAVVLVCLGIWKYYRDEKFFLFGFAVFLIGFGPLGLASILKTKGMMIEPHWFVFSSIGFFIMLSVIVSKLKCRFVLVGILLVAYVSLARGYNQLWSSEQGYCLYWLKEVPEINAAKFYLARSYLQQGDYAQARIYYQKALSGGFADGMIYANLGLIDLKEGRLVEAKEKFLKSLQVNPQESFALNGLGTIAGLQKDFSTAETFFRQAIAVDPMSVTPRLNLARLYLRQNYRREALTIYQTILQIWPNHPEARAFVEKENRGKMDEGRWTR